MIDKYDEEGATNELLSCILVFINKRICANSEFIGKIPYCSGSINMYKAIGALYESKLIYKYVSDMHQSYEAEEDVILNSLVPYGVQNVNCSVIKDYYYDREYEVILNDEKMFFINRFKNNDNRFMLRDDYISVIFCDLRVEGCSIKFFDEKCRELAAISLLGKADRSTI